MPTIIQIEVEDNVFIEADKITKSMDSNLSDFLKNQVNELITLNSHIKKINTINTIEDLRATLKFSHKQVENSEVIPFDDVKDIMSKKFGIK